MNQAALWQRFEKYLCTCPGVGLKLDISRLNFEDVFFNHMQPGMEQAYLAMEQLEAGAIANPDEQRKVGHYWLRNPDISPDQETKSQITQTLADITAFASDIHQKKIIPPNAKRYTDLLVVGIGGSALGPQLVADALGTKRDKMAVHFLDNTDPDGADRAADTLGARLKSTLVLVISKSGGTKETRNGMLEMQNAFEHKGLDFAKQAVAITGDGSKLDQHAKANHWLKTFPMWDWVGGRTSVLSAVGLLPAALQGVDIGQLLAGAAKMDEYTRKKTTKQNPAALLALMWHYATEGKGAKDMVILPYKDRLLLMSRYLQQLVMESLGKEHDLSGNVVNQGIAVYGNKGSTDQHAYVQQLRDGLNNFFITFIVVLQDRQPAQAKKAREVDPGLTSGDYLNGFWQGTRQALYDKDRSSITITLDKVNAHSIGALIALYERAVGFYATLVNINAYHQPGVEAGKVAAQEVLDRQLQAVAHLQKQSTPQSPQAIADQLGQSDQVESIYHILEHLAANKRGVKSARGKYSAL